MDRTRECVPIDDRLTLTNIYVETTAKMDL